MAPPPPPRRPQEEGGAAAPPSTGKTPVAYRTRGGRSRIPPPAANRTKSINFGTNGPGGRSGAPAAPPSTTASMTASSPSAAGVNMGATAGAGKHEPGSSPADDIARRRAELRRLQQRRGDGLALARSRLGGADATATNIMSRPSSNAMKFRPPPRPAPAAGGAAPATYLAPPTAGAPVSGSAAAATPTPPAVAMAGATPPTEIVKRRLEGSYGPRDAPQRPAAPTQPPVQQQEAPPQSQKEQQRQRSKSQPPPRRGNQKRDSEIFAAGRRRQQQQGGQQQPTQTANAPAVGCSGSFDRNAARSAIGYTASFDGASGVTSPGGTSGGYLQNSVLHTLTMASPRSPFGQPRKVAEVVIPDGRGVPFPAMPGLLPEDSVREVGEDEVEVEADVAPADEVEVAADLDAWVQRHSPPCQEKQRASVDSGKATPVHSNVHTSGEAVAVAGDGPGDAPADKVDASRLAEELKRAEEEKRAALAQVDRLKARLDETQQRTEEEKPKRMTEGLLAQFRERIATHGESAAVAWIAAQLERDAAAPMSSPAKRGRSMSIGASIGASPFGEVGGGGGGDLLESVIPPLTPRGRPGSRDNPGELDEGRGKRVATPLPKRLQQSSPEGAPRSGTGATGNPVEREYLAAAARTIPSEYGTRLASHFVRRPYADEASSEEGMWSAHSHLSTGDAYRRNATASDPASLEVLARIDADGSVFTLAGACEARHGRLAGTGGEGREWTVFADVEGREAALGRVAYIDAEGNERDYWLDSIYEEALTTRESYCMSMLSAAFALKEVTGGGSLAALPAAGGAGARPPVAFAPVHHPPQTVRPPSPMVREAVVPPLWQGAGPAMPLGSDGQQQRPPLRPAVQPCNVNVSQSGIPADESTMQPPAPEMPAVQTLPPTAAPEQPSTEVKPGVALREESKPQQPQPQPDTKPPTTTKQPAGEEFESADSALPFLVVSLVSLLFSMVWFVVKIPFRIGSTLFAFWVTVAALRILWLCFADDNGAYEMGAGIDWEFNMAGIR